jgi:hypothetical protein
MPGQLRLRVRWRDLAGPWFDYLIVSPTEMAVLVRRVGRAFQRPKLLLVFGSAALYCAGVVLLAAWVGLWHVNVFVFPLAIELILLPV